MVFDRLNELNDRYIELEQRMEQPEVYTDAEAYSRCARELRELEPVITAFRSYQEAVAAMDDARSLMDDPEMRELAQDELEDAMSRRDQLEHELQLLLLPKDPNDSKNVIMEIRGGVGGEEGMLFAHDLYRMYTMYAASKGWEIEVANSNLTELGGVKEISFIVKGEGAWSRLKYEAGGHRVQRVPVTESGGRIHTSAATVAVLPEVDDIDFKIDPKDLKIDTYRSSGAGGQHINKTESAVFFVPVCMNRNCRNRRTRLPRNGRARSAPATVLTGCAPTIFPRTVSRIIVSTERSAISTSIRSSTEDLTGSLMLLQLSIRRKN